MTTSADAQYLKMTQKPVSKLIAGLSIPTIISMLIANIYNTADTYFVSSISTAASGAIGIVFSLMAIQQAFGFMFGHGAGSIIARALGKRENDAATMYASTSFCMSIFFGIIILVLGLVFLDPFMYLLGSTKTILPYAKTYAIYILLAGPFLTSSCVMNNILRYEGRAVYAMVGLTAGGILNMIGDPILMFVFHMGVDGAGLSTLLSQIISFLILLFMYLSGKTQSKLRFGKVSYHHQDILNIVSTGFPSLTRQGLNSISVMILNNQAGIYGDAAIAAVSIVNRIAMLITSIAIGIGQGLQPVAAFNYGARFYSRVHKGFHFTWLMGTVLIVGASALCFFNSEVIIEWFRKDSAVVSIGAQALRYALIGLIFNPFAISVDMMLQSCGKSRPATFMASTRSGLFFIPLILILPNLFGLNGVIVSQPIANILSFVISVPFAKIFLNSLPEDGVNI